MSSRDFRMTDLRTQFLVISQEQIHQTKSIGELRLAIAALTENLAQLEGKIAMLESAHNTHIVGSIEGLPGNVSVTFPPQWGGDVPLVERDGSRRE